MRKNKIIASLFVVLIFGGAVVSASADQSTTLDNNLRREALVRAVQTMVAEKTVPFDLQEEGGVVSQSFQKAMTEDTQGDGTVDITSATIGFNQPGVPCFDGCVDGAIDTAVGLPFPIKSFAVGDNVEYTVTVDSTAAGGALKAFVLFTIIDDTDDQYVPIASDAVSIPVLPGFFILITFPGQTVPDLPDDSADTVVGDIVVLIINSDLETLATHVVLDAVNISR